MRSTLCRFFYRLQYGVAGYGHDAFQQIGRRGQDKFLLFHWNVAVPRRKPADAFLIDMSTQRYCDVKRVPVVRAGVTHVEDNVQLVQDRVHLFVQHPFEFFLLEHGMRNGFRQIGQYPYLLYRVRYSPGTGVPVSRCPPWSPRARSADRSLSTFRCRGGYGRTAHGQRNTRKSRTVVVASCRVAGGGGLRRPREEDRTGPKRERR